jgi:hypothetical protein
MSTPGERFAEAIATRDAASMAGLMAADVDFRGITPNQFWEAKDPTNVVDVVLGNWFEETDHIRSVVRAEAPEVSDTRHVSYRFDIDNEDGARVVEQQAYYRTEGDKVVWMRVVCSGFRPRD